MKSSRLSRKSVNGSKQTVDCGPANPSREVSLAASSSKHENEQIKAKSGPEQSGVNGHSVREESIGRCEWLLGDVAWARVGGHPFWPCIISNDPEQNAFTKTSLRGTTETQSLHVQFFADNGRRSWLSAACVIPFEGVEALNKLQEKLQKEAKKRDKKLLSAFNVRNSAKTSWNEAVREAVVALKKTRSERIQHFNKRYPIKRSDDKTAAEKLDDSQQTERPRKKRKYSHRESTSVQVKQESDASPPASLKKAAKSSSALPQTSATSAPLLKKKYYPKKFKSSDDKLGAKAYVSKFRSRMAAEHPNLNEKTIKKHLKNEWSGMDENGKAKFCMLNFPENLSDDSGTLSNEEENDVKSSVKESTETKKPGSATMKSPFLQWKDGDLFRGRKPENVCIICERPGNIVKCKGLCSDFYHVECDGENKKEIPNAEKNKKERPSSSKTHIIEDHESGNEKETHTDKIKGKTLSKEEGKAGKSSAESIKVDPKEEGKDETNAEEFRCKRCQAGEIPTCFICQRDKVEKTNVEKRYRCSIGYCHKYFHVDCLKSWPQASIGGTSRAPQKHSDASSHKGNGVRVTCPQHVCHACVCDVQNVNKRFTNDKLACCIRCPTAYHYGNYCLPAGSDVLTGTQIVCPRHYKPPQKKAYIVNTSWCSICSKEGSMLGCQFCPASFHTKCLKITYPEGGYTCEDCEKGRVPLYGEVVWVKFSNFRWWPAQILFPKQVPPKIKLMPHVRGEFAVKFFGSHDHYWVNRGRVLLYQERVTGTRGGRKSSVDGVFNRALQEAREAFRALKFEKAAWDAEAKTGF